MNFIINALFSLLIIYLALLLFLFIKQEKMLFFPRGNDAVNVRQFDEFAYSVQSQGHTLTGWYVPGKIEPHGPLILYFGGNAEDVSWNLLETHKYKNNSFVFMNYRGYGSSDGSPSQDAFYQDALAIYDDIVSRQHIRPEDIIVMGRSIGTAVAVWLAAHRQVKAVILVTPFDSIAEIAQDMYPIFPVKSLLKHAFNAVENTRNSTMPLLMITGDKDSITPYKNSDKLYQAWKGRKHWVRIADADHNDISGFPEYFDAINDFFDSDLLRY